MSDRVLSIWTVYDHPRDQPDAFVARRWDIQCGVTYATSDMFVAPTLNEIRALLPPGLVRMTRDVTDDPVIVESWV